MPEPEGRLSRWSRLKRKGGATPEENAVAEEEVAETSGAKARGRATPTAVAEVSDPESKSEEPYYVPDPQNLPGGLQKRSFVAPMRPLAEPEEGESAYEAAPTDAMAMLTGEPDEEAVGTPSVEIGQDAEAERDLTPEEKEAVDALPPIETLTKESDFTPFMSEKVPEFIRRRALRVLWRSDPLLANLDGLNDYDEDYNIIDKLIDAATGNYKVGKGMPGPGDEEWEEEQKREAEAEADAAKDAEHVAGENVTDATAAEGSEKTFPDPTNDEKINGSGVGDDSESVS